MDRISLTYLGTFFGTCLAGFGVILGAVWLNDNLSNTWAIAWVVACAAIYVVVLVWLCAASWRLSRLTPKYVDLFIPLLEPDLERQIAGLRQMNLLMRDMSEVQLRSVQRLVLGHRANKAA